MQLCTEDALQESYQKNHTCVYDVTADMKEQNNLV